MSHDAQSNGARKSNSPWRGNNRMFIKKRGVLDNARAQQKALKSMSLLERETGHDEAWWSEWHRIQRERVLARYGVTKCAQRAA